MARSYFIIIALFITALLVVPGQADAQSRSYEFVPSPDLWYNDVDGIKIGIRLKGQVPGTFEDGPHRLDAGIMLNTWIPDLPVSYDVRFTEPITTWSEYGSEANVQFSSSIQTGYHTHGVSLNKRWQQGFNERSYREVGIFNAFEKRFDDEYAAFPVLWSDDNKLLTHLRAELQNTNPLGWYNVSLNSSFQYLDEGYNSTTLRVIQEIPFNENWGFKVRGFAGITSSDAAPEYRFSRSGATAIDYLNSGLTRAKGTIPQPWMRGGNVQVAGGANLRGYTSQDVSTFVDENSFGEVNPLLFSSIIALNTEFDYLNPIGILFNRLPYISDFISFRSYLFFDAGKSLQIENTEPDQLFADAGAGFSLSLNIPDYLGKPRGFVLRYELPVWLSEPGTEDSFKLRHLFAVGAVISF